MYKTFVYSLLVLITILFAANSFSQDSGLSKVSTGNGLHTTDFNLPEGVLAVNLPSDITVAESASGSVFLRGGNSPNLLNQIFSKYNLVVESRIVNITGNSFTIQVPVNLPTGVLSVSLQDKQGRIINRAFFPVRLTKRSQLPLNAGGKGNFRTPVTSRAGMPAIINGPFDGSFQNSFISISGQPVSLLSESTRQLVFLIPDGVQGQKVLSLREGATEFKTPFTVLYVVKVGRDNPALVSRKDSTDYTGSAGGSQGVLIESEKQFGKIDLDYNPDLGETSQKKDLSASTAKKYPANEQPGLGPSMDDLSKPLELKPEDLKQYSTQAKAVENIDKQPASLKQPLDKPEVKAEPVTKTPVNKPPVVTDKTVKEEISGFSDINEVKPLLEKQISMPFTPLEPDDAVQKTKVASADKKSEKKKTEVKTPAPKKEIKPVTSTSNIKAKPIPPKVPLKTPPVKKETKVSNKDKAAKPSEYSSKMKDKAVKTETEVKKNDAKDNKKKNEEKVVATKNKATAASSGKENKKYKEINDLSSLNAFSGSFKSTDRKAEVSSDAGIKEEKYVSLKKKETPKPQAETSAGKSRFAVQLASFKKESEASDLVSRLKAGGYDVYYKKSKVPGKGYWYRVKKGGFTSRKDAEEYKKTLNLSKYNLSSFFITIEN